MRGGLREAFRSGLEGVLGRCRVLLEAKRQLDLPFNLNAQMIAEQLCLHLAGLARQKPVPPPSR